MKKLKNNKGITGIDIVVSITIIVIVLGISLTVYNSYSEKSKEVKRTSVATNLAMKVIEKIEEITIDEITVKSSPSNEIDISGYDLGTVPQGYEIKAIKKDIESNTLINSLAFKVDVIVTYSVGVETKSVTLSTIKKKNETKEAEEPNIKGNEITINEGTEEAKVEVIPVKYDASKNGYVETDSRDSDWYSISSKVFPIVIKLKDDVDFDRNGVIQLSQCENIYVWVPSYGTDANGKYRFCDIEGKIINYASEVKEINDSTYYISSYKINNVETVSGTVSGGKWVEVYEENKELVSTDDDYQDLINNIFTWE